MSYTRNQTIPPPPGSRRKVVAAGLVSFVLVNVAAALALRSALRRDQPDTSSMDEAVEVSALPTPTSATGVPDPARAHRLAGLDAMEHQDYDRAIHELTAAARAGDDTPELLRLISLAQDLRSRGAIPSAPAPEQQVPEVAAEVRALIGAARRRPRARSADEQPSAAQSPAATVAVAEQAIVPSPERGGLAADPPPSPVVAAPAPPASLEPPPPVPPPRAVVPAAAPTRSADPVPRPAPVPVAPRVVGELEVLSPNVPGEVWVNGRGHGLAPRVVRDVPVGSARVEIRVDGVVRRSRVVQVRERQRTRVPLL